ncbi:MAG: hypothetical protein SVK08_01630 [Halobacteriota archaeon]|nr:hypothetical protein [Halobacteriota archaeon]
MSETTKGSVNFRDEHDLLVSEKIPPEGGASALFPVTRRGQNAVVSWEYIDVEKLYINGFIYHNFDGQFDVTVDKDRSYLFVPMISGDQYPETVTSKTLKPYFGVFWAASDGYCFGVGYNGIQMVQASDGFILAEYTPDQDWIIEPYSAIQVGDEIVFVVSSASSFKVIRMDMTQMGGLGSVKINATSDTFTFTHVGYEPRFGLNDDGTYTRVVYREGNVLTLKKLNSSTLVDTGSDEAIDIVSQVENEAIGFIGVDDFGDIFTWYYDGSDTEVYKVGKTSMTISGSRIERVIDDGFYSSGQYVYRFNDQIFDAGAEIHAICIYRENWIAFGTADNSDTPDMFSVKRFLVSDPSDVVDIADVPISGVGDQERFCGTMTSAGTTILGGIYTNLGRRVALKLDGESYTSSGVSI